MQFDRLGYTRRSPEQVSKGASCAKSQKNMKKKQNRVNRPIKKFKKTKGEKMSKEGRKWLNSNVHFNKDWYIINHGTEWIVVFGNIDKKFEDMLINIGGKVIDNFKVENKFYRGFLFHKRHKKYLEGFQRV